MNRFLGAVLVALGVFSSACGQQQRAPDAAEAQRQLEELRADAARNHPGLAGAEAVHAEGVAQTSAALAAASGEQKYFSAAGMFYGFYFLNTIARPEYCKAHGVDIATFVSAFAKAHSAELDRARAIYARAGRDPDQERLALMPSFASMVEQDMSGVQAQARTSASGVCKLFNERADAVVASLVLPEPIRVALMRPD